MNKTSDWNPGHSVSGGYPWQENIAKFFWSKRPIIKLDPRTRKVVFDATESGYPPFIRSKDLAIQFTKYLCGDTVNDPECKIKTAEDHFEDFRDQLSDEDFEDRLLFVAAEAMETLSAAQGQVDDMLKEDPFTPELLGFDVAVSNKTIDEPPIRIYTSLIDDRFSIYRKPGSPADDDWNPHEWILIRKNDDGSMHDTNLCLPCQRIAYAALWALGVKMKEDIVELVIDTNPLP